MVKTPGLIPDLPRKEAVAKFRLLTGHDCLAQTSEQNWNKRIAQLYFVSTECRDEWIAPLSTCPNLNYTKDIVVKYWDARRKMM